MIAGVRSSPTKSLSGLLARFPAPRGGGSPSEALESGRFALPYTRPPGGRGPFVPGKAANRLEGLGSRIRDLESTWEAVRNERQMVATSFQNFDQKANQLYNLLSSVMKTMSEMRMSTVRNMR